MRVHRKRRRYDYPEKRIHKRGVAELRLAFALIGFEAAPFFHTPNEGIFSKREAAERDAMGLSPGQVDLVIVFPTRSGRPGAAIEVKAPDGTLDPKQRQWLQWWAAAGFEARCTYGHRELANTLAELGYITAEQARQWIAIVTRTDPSAL